MRAKIFVGMGNGFEMVCVREQSDVMTLVFMYIVFLAIVFVVIPGDIMVGAYATRDKENSQDALQPRALFS